MFRFLPPYGSGSKTFRFLSTQYVCVQCVQGSETVSPFYLPTGPPTAMEARVFTSCPHNMYSYCVHSSSVQDSEMFCFLIALSAVEARPFASCLQNVYSCCAKIARCFACYRPIAVKANHFASCPHNVFLLCSSYCSYRRRDASLLISLYSNGSETFPRSKRKNSFASKTTIYCRNYPVCILCQKLIFTVVNNKQCLLYLSMNLQQYGLNLQKANKHFPK